MENLAPAGSREALERAIAAGADAVYLGYSAYSARAGAGNFDEEQLRDAIRLCHLHHVRVHVTVNTLVKDHELDGVYRVLSLLEELRADAVLVQDLGILRMARRCFPALPVHASTQMAIHNAAGVRFCRKAGCTRVVLARECSLEEIRLCAAEGIEIEVFGHGAQCVAVSGECLFSSMLGERSGNRGRCAQPCRLPYTWRGRTAAWLSPCDVCLRDDLPALAGAGACSVKLEGRLKRPEYVAQVTSSYRRGIDSLEAGRFRPADADEKRDLLQVFQRGGFMRGYVMGCEDAAVIEPERVNHGGVAVGRVRSVSGRLAEADAELPLHDGDQLRIEGAHPDCEMIYAGRPVPAGGRATLRLRPDMRVRPGDRVVRLTDAEQMERLRAIPLPSIPCRLSLTARPGEPLTLTATDGSVSVTVAGDVVEPARQRPLTAEDAARSLGKAGGTAFTVEAVTADTEGAFVPVSALNSLRREALDRLADARAEAFCRPTAAGLPPEEDDLPRGSVPPVWIVREPEQAADAPAGALVALSPEDWRADALEAMLGRMPDGTWLALPTVSEERTLEEIRALTERLAPRLGGVLLGSVGQLGLAWPVPVAAGPGVPVMNRLAARLLLDAGCAFVTASPELTGRETRALLAGDPPVAVPAYGRARLMILHHCPARTALGLTRGHAACRMCDAGDPDSLRGGSLTDRRGAAYPLLRRRLPEGCLVELMNSLPTDVRREVREAGWAPVIELTDERSLPAEGAAETTSGHWRRAVE